MVSKTAAERMLPAIDKAVKVHLGMELDLKTLRAVLEDRKPGKPVAHAIVACLLSALAFQQLLTVALVNWLAEE